RQALNASSDIRVDYRSLRVGQTAAGLKAGESMQRRLETFTRERPSWVDDVFTKGVYNVYILDDIDSKAFKDEELKALADRVGDGAGLIMLGGLHSFGAGGYASTPLAAVSPTELRTVDRQPLDAPLRQDIHYPSPVSIRLTPEGRRHYVLRLAANPLKNVEIWESFPPLAGANKLGKLKPGATLLAEGQDGQELLVSQLYGLGRVLAFAGDSTYRWRLGGFAEEHKRFWRQVVLWLAKMEGIMEGDCWLTLDSVRILPGETAKFQVFLQSADKQELRGFSAKATVIKPDGSEERITLVDEEGTPTGSFRNTTLPGDYTIKAEATHESFPADTPVKTAEARFIVQDKNLELDNPAASPQLLKNIAETTGGHSVVPEQFGKLLNELREKSGELVEKRETKQPLYDSPGLLWAFVCALCLEWFLRKYWGMV
ncbi:MAG: glutamine amidotransferase, partial [Planctomycetaceae bacterium]|nr:glutamine amidotransferase [Planctomycetaceae bacterium]